MMMVAYIQSVSKGLLVMAINASLFELARQRLVKAAFVPSEAAAQSAGPPPGGGGGPPPGGGGPPPMDPSMGGGGPPPPMDPGAGGGPPPMDPGMGGGMPPPPPDGGLGDIDAKVQKAVQSALQGAGMQGAGGPKQPKPDINTVATDLFQLKKMFLAYLRRQGIELPPDILDGPNRDPATGAPAVSPTGGSDVQPGSSSAGAIPPINPIQPAMINAISGGGQGGKQANHLSLKEAEAYLLKEASEVLRLYSIIKEREALAEDIWASTVEKSADVVEIQPVSSPGEPYPNPAKRVTSKAAAIAKVFRRKRSA